MSQGLFSVSVVSLPLNFTILLHPDSIASLGIEENGYALVKGINGLITVVKVIKDQDCPATGTRITHSVQMTLGASPGDSVPILPFSGNEHCEAIQVAPLFDKNSMSNEGSDFTTAVTHYFQTEPRPISVDSIFTLIIDSEERAFKILKCSPTDRSFSSKSTKLYFAAEPGPLLPKPLISKHLNTLVLDKQIVNFVKNNIYFPVNRQSILRSLNLPTSTGILIEGPPGSGKTSLLSAISNTINIPSIYCQSKRLKKLSVPDYVEKLNQVFGYTAEKPQCLIMFDDIDYILTSFQQSKLTADRVKLATFFNLLDAVMSRGGIFVISTATSPLINLDSALLRDGRFGQRITLTQPTLDQRKELIRLYTGGMRVEDEDLEEICRKIGGKGESNSPLTVSAKEIERICRIAVTTLIEEATGNTGAEVVDSLAVYTLNTKMKAMHFGVTTTLRGRNRSRDRSGFRGGGDDDEDEDGGSHRRRRRRRRHHGDDDGEEDDDENGSSRRRHRHHRRRRHHGDDEDDDENNEEDEDDQRRRRRHRRHHTNENTSSGGGGSSGRRRHQNSFRRRYEDEEEEEMQTTNRNRRRNNFNEDDDDENENNGRRRGKSGFDLQQRQNRNKLMKNNNDDDDEPDPFTRRDDARRRKNRIDDDDDDQSPFNRNKRSPFQRRGRGDDDDENEDDDDQFVRKSRKEPQQRRGAGNNQRGRNNIDEDDDDQIDETENRKRASRPSRRNGGRGFAQDDDENEDDEDNRNVRRRSNNRRRNLDDDEDENDDRERRPRTRRSRQAFQDFDDDDDDEEQNFQPRRRNK